MSLPFQSITKANISPFTPLAGDIYYIIVPVVVVVVILKLCLIFWRVWVYQKVRNVFFLYGVCDAWGLVKIAG